MTYRLEKIERSMKLSWLKDSVHKLLSKIIQEKERIQIKEEIKEDFKTDTIK